MRDLREIINEHLAKGRVMQLATVKEGQPWLCTVNYVFDENLNLYWHSMRSRRHSEEISADPHAAVAIVPDPKVKQGLQVAGEAAEVEDSDLERVDALYGERHGAKPDRLQDARSENPDSRTFYQIKPTEVVFWDEVNFPENPRQKLEL